MEENNKNIHSSGEKPKIEIEINKYKRLVDVLNNPKLLAKAIVVLAIIIVLVFVGVSAIALVIKTFYPYKAVETNKYGATVIKNEDTEVTYWLFNSADLWANSGIKVEKGQRITVRTSGAFHSAIHHLVRDANTNHQSDKWLNATGGMQSMNSHDKARSKFKIADEYEFNTVIMQVIPNRLLKKGRDWFKQIDDTLYWDYIDGGSSKLAQANIYRIGEGYDNIEIQEDGILCFACNDIALTQRKINKMRGLLHMAKLKDAKGNYQIVDTGALKVGGYYYDVYTKKDARDLFDYIDNNKNQILKNCYDRSSVCKLQKTLKDVSDRIQDDKDSINISDRIKIDSLIKRTLTELDYYGKNKFIDAWFVDNVGSFLIVVEREK